MLFYNESHAYDPTAGMALSNIRRQKKLHQKRLRNMTWDDYGISKYRYRELKNFCLQYPEKKEQISYGLTSHEPAEVHSGRISRPTENQAISNSPYIQDCLMIEQAAAAASREIAPWILVSVTEDLNYEELEYYPELGRIPINRFDFYGVRRLFYSILDKKRK